MKKNINSYPAADKNYFKPNTKEYFKIIYKSLKTKKKNSLLDIGCASGDFLKLFEKVNFDLYGVDFSRKLIQLAKKKVCKGNFKIANIEKKIPFTKKFDICTCLGILSIFENPLKILNKIISVTKSKGRIIIFNNINEYGLNILTKYQNYNSADRRWYSAFNSFSKQYWIKNILLNTRVKKLSFKKFEMPFGIKKNIKKPLRAWTYKNRGKNQVTVGTEQLLNFYIITIVLK